MEYPGTKFNKKYRLAFLIFMVILFFLISPAVVMYTAGYRYDWNNGFLRKVGAISIDVKPGTAQVYLNGVLLKKKIPIRLKNLLPGKYKILISLEGYYDWEKEMEVENKQTGYIKDVNLIKKENPSALIDKKVLSFSLSPDGRYLVYLTDDPQNEQAQKLVLKDLSGAKSDLEFYSLSKTNGEIELSWSDEENCAVLNRQDKNYGKLLIFCADRPEQVYDLDELFGKIQKFQWRKNSSPQFYFENDNGIKSFYPLTGQTQNVTSKKYEDWYMDGNSLWILEKNKNGKQYLLIEDALGFSKTFENFDLRVEENLKLVAVDNNRILLKKEKKSEMILIDNGAEYQISGENFLQSPHNNWWLIWTPWELWTHNAGNEPILTVRSGKDLKEPVPLDQYNTLAMVWKDTVEIYYPYYSVNLDFLDKNIEKGYSDYRKKIFYFLSEEKIWQINY